MAYVTLTEEVLAAAVDAMNNDHQRDLINYARILGGAAWARSAVMAELDAEGFSLLIDDGEGRREIHRLAFPQPVDDPDGLRYAFIQLADQADLPDGRLREASARVETLKASRYLKALCNHFDRKANASYGDSDGRVGFPWGECSFHADDVALSIHVSANTDTRLTRVKHVVADHLERFAAAEGLRVNWEEAAA